MGDLTKFDEFLQNSSKFESKKRQKVSLMGDLTPQVRSGAAKNGFDGNFD
jgi:hypothetical protein